MRNWLPTHFRSIICIGACAASVACSQTVYIANRDAYAELTPSAGPFGLRIHNGTAKYYGAGDAFEDYPEFVSCVPEAYRHARRARIEGIASYSVAGLATTLGVAGLIVTAVDSRISERAFWVDAVALLGGSAALILRHRATGHAVDAMNFYNDQVGSLGASCAALSYVTARPFPLPPAGPPDVTKFLRPSAEMPRAKSPGSSRTP